jgi:hypothetical protein
MAGALSTLQDIWTFLRDARVLSRPSPTNLTVKKHNGRGGIATFRNCQFHHHSRDQYADGFGQILDKLQDKPGYSALWLLCKLTVPAAAPTHPHRTMGGSSAGSMAPLLATTEVATPLPSSARHSTPAQTYPSHPHQTMGGSPKGLMAPSLATPGATTPSLHLASPSSPAWSTPSPPTTTGGGATAAEHHATTTLQCWKRCIWLSHWFAQQAEQHQRCLRLRSLCRGALAYAMLVWGNCQPPPTPTNKTSDPKVLHHPFRDCGLPLPQRRRARRNNHPPHCPGQRHWPHAPDTGGGLLCMSLIFWATQTTAASDLLGVGDGSMSTSYISPTSAASLIQLAYRSYVRWISRYNNPTISMLFACISFCLLRSCRPSNCAVNSVYKQYIHWKRYELDVNSIHHGLDYFYWQCNKSHIKMDAESKLICGALDVLTRSYNTG